MNMTAGYGVSTGACQGTLTIKKAGDFAVNMRTPRKKNNSSSGKKLKYNSREISSQLVRAKKSQNASIVLIRAKGKLGTLQRALASGDYNEKEVRSAIAHAKRIVECSRMKVRNLKEEEQMVKQKKQKLEEKILQQELIKKQRMHRNRERGKISEADMKYIEDQMKNSHMQTDIWDTGVSLELQGLEMTASMAESIVPEGSAAVDVTI